MNSEREFCCPLYDDDFECRRSVAERLRGLANDICDTQGMDVKTERILFLYDRTPYKGGPAGEVFLMPEMARQTLYQTSGCVFDVAICLKERRTDTLCEAQLSHELYHCLRHVGYNAKTKRLEVIKRHDVEQWLEQLPFAEGDGYAVDSPNLFDERIYPNAGIGTEKKKEEAA